MDTLQKISVIIPVLNEAKILEKTLSQLQPELGSHELIVVDGGSTDASVRIAEKYGRVITSERGRAKQLNAGAAAATGEILIFLHADIWLESGALAAVVTALSSGYVGGGFRQKIDAEGFLYRLIEMGGDLRGRYLKVFYGDSGIFLTRMDFEKLGGFPDVPIMEEMKFSRELRCLGKTTLLTPYIHISARRWEASGIVRTTLKNWLITLLYFFGVSPGKLARLYRHIR
ncbi:MAG: TIGR04283 family arsenosugar biosynthesis glycosyltransferase [Candidatus Poribacteria bacterium]|nr:TIGR04283 family arsenosugar biosynthesis glycosyltransferase [Candidatus Poribacteria bacterium]